MCWAMEAPNKNPTTAFPYEPREKGSTDNSKNRHRFCSPVDGHPPFLSEKQKIAEIRVPA